MKNPNLQQNLHDHAFLQTDDLKDIIFSTDNSFRIVSWNEAAEKFYGISSTRAKGSLLPDVIKPGFDENDLKKIDESIAASGFWEGQVTHQSGDGKEHIIDESIIAMNVSNGVRAGYVFIGRNGSLQRGVEQKNHYHSAVLDRINEAVFSTDTLRNIQNWNAGALKMFGFTCDEVIGKTSLEVLKPDIEENEMEVAKKVVLELGHWAGQIIYHHKNGNAIPIDISVSLYTDHERNDHFIYVCRDMTDKKMEENKLTNRTKQLEEANQLIYAMSLSVSRDMRKQLHASRLSVQQLEKMPGLHGNAQTVIKQLNEQINELFQISDNLLSFSDIAYTDLNLVTVDMNALVNKCINALMTANEKSLMTIIKQDLPSCKGDAAMLEQVWYSLLTASIRNACLLKDPFVKLESIKENDTVTYLVTPYKVVKDEYIHEGLEDLYHRLAGDETEKDSERELNFIKRVLLRHGGSIGINTVSGTGPKFNFTLPRV